MTTFREPVEADWVEIGRLADAAVQHIPGAPRQGTWVANRKTFSGLRRHLVLEGEGQIVGYGAIELNATSVEARLFLVLAWRQPESVAIASALYERLRAEAATMKIGDVWMREFAADAPFIDFLIAHGFQVRRKYELDGMGIVELARKRFATPNERRQRWHRLLRSFQARARAR